MRLVLAPPTQAIEKQEDKESRSEGSSVTGYWIATRERGSLARDRVASGVPNLLAG